MKISRTLLMCNFREVTQIVRFSTVSISTKMILISKGPVSSCSVFKLDYDSGDLNGDWITENYFLSPCTTKIILTLSVLRRSRPWIFLLLHYLWLWLLKNIVEFNTLLVLTFGSLPSTTTSLKRCLYCRSISSLFSVLFFWRTPSLKIFKYFFVLLTRTPQMTLFH